MTSEIAVQRTLWLFQKVRPEPAPTPTTSPDPKEGHGGLRIRCPRCHWQPTKNDVWSCLCDHAWNTFDTGGKCPRCGRVWEQTQCPRCHQWSRHDDWYEWQDSSHDT